MPNKQLYFLHYGTFTSIKIWYPVKVYLWLYIKNQILQYSLQASALHCR